MLGHEAIEKRAGPGQSQRLDVGTRKLARTNARGPRGRALRAGHREPREKGKADPQPEPGRPEPEHAAGIHGRHQHEAVNPFRVRRGQALRQPAAPRLTDDVGARPAERVQDADHSLRVRIPG
jgi:hypothetical protein